MQKQQREIEIDAKDLARYLVKHWVSIAATVLLAALIGFSYQSFIATPVYESQSMIYITTGSSGGSVMQNMLSSLQAGTALTADYKTLATSKPVLEQVIKDLDLDTDYAELKKRVDTENPDNTRILILSVKDTDQRMAKKIVDKLTEIEQVKIADVMNTAKPNVMQWGDIQNDPVSPSPLRTSLCCGLIALIFTLLFFIIRFIQSDTIATAEDIDRVLDLRTLAEIPYIPKDGKGRNKRKTRRSK